VAVLIDGNLMIDISTIDKAITFVEEPSQLLVDK
jgi:hypothetical protein